MLPFSSVSLEGRLALGLALTGVVLVMARRWRPTLAALFTQYLLAGLLLAASVGSWGAGMKILVGTMSCMILYGTHYYLQELGDVAQAGEGRGVRLMAGRLGMASQVLGIVLVGGVVEYLLGNMQIPGLSPVQSFGCYWLIASGFLTLILASSLLKAGVGILSLQMGFEIFYTVQESSLSVVGLLGVVHLFLALTIAYFISGASLSSPGQEGD